MASTSALLTIPRELRELIYAYLTHASDFIWHWSNSITYCAIGNAFVHIEGAPYRSIMLAHSRLHDECFDWCIKRLSVTIRFKPGLDQEDMFKHVLGAQRFAMKIFSHTRHATILGNFTTSLWEKFEQFFDVFLSMTPHLSMLRIAVTGESGHRLVSPDSVLNPYLYYKDFLDTPPNTLVDLPLVQRAEGYRLCFKPPSWVGPHDPIYPHANTWPTFEIYKVGAYVYGRRVKEEHFWEAKEVEGCFHIRGCPSYLRHRTDLDIERIDRATEMMGWRDKRGEETSHWHDEDPNCDAYMP